MNFVTISIVHLLRFLYFFSIKIKNSITMILQTVFQTWLPFIYLYVVGGIFFFSGMYIIIKSGSLDPKKKSHKFWIKVLFGGYFFFLFLHAFLIISALYL